MQTSINNADDNAFMAQTVESDRRKPDAEKLLGDDAQAREDEVCPKDFYRWRLLPVFDDADAKKLGEHKYAGVDRGITYVYFWNPVANWLCSLLPEWVAPNLITFVGFLHTIAAFVLVFGVFGPSLVGPIPSWACYLLAHLYLWYRMFDEMDGKQARRNGNSSPLGLLFDHGCDCFAAGMWSLIALRVGQYGNNWLAVMFVCVGLWAFHFTTLEEYYTGILELEVGNAVSDGAVALIVFFIFTGIVGTEFWVQKAFDIDLAEGMTYMTYGQLAYTIFICLIFLTVIVEFYKILHSRSNPKPTQSEYPDLRHLSLQVFGILNFAAIWVWYGTTGTQPIFAANTQVTLELYNAQPTNPEPHASYMLFYMLLYSFTICHVTIWLQLCHVSRQKFQPYTKLFTFVCVTLLATGIATYFTESVNTRLTAMGLLAIQQICQWLFLIRVIYEITTALDIPLFRTKQSYAASRAAAASRESGQEDDQLQTPLL